jgi:hypothetical protein
VYQLLAFYTSRASATRISLLLVDAVDILGVGKGKGKASASFIAQEQLSMTDPVLFDRMNQTLFDFVLTDDVVEKHGQK